MTRTQATPTFEMTVDLNVLEHLGINLYSNIAAVLTEAVANAWDADASSVQIRVDPNSEWIEIEDDGVGTARPRQPSTAVTLPSSRCVRWWCC